MTAANTNLHTRFYARRAAQKKLDTTFNKLIGDGNGMTAFVGDGYTGSQHMVCVTARYRRAGLHVLQLLVQLEVHHGWDLSLRGGGISHERETERECVNHQRDL